MVSRLIGGFPLSIAQAFLHNTRRRGSWTRGCNGNALKFQVSINGYYMVIIWLIMGIYGGYIWLLYGYHMVIIWLLYGYKYGKLQLNRGSPFFMENPGNWENHRGFSSHIGWGYLPSRYASRNRQFSNTNCGWGWNTIQISLEREETLPKFTTVPYLLTTCCAFPCNQTWFRRIPPDCVCSKANHKGRMDPLSTPLLYHPGSKGSQHEAVQLRLLEHLSIRPSIDLSL